MCRWGPSISTRRTSHFWRRDPLETVFSINRLLSLQIPDLKVAQPGQKQEVMIRGSVRRSKGTHPRPRRALTPVREIQPSNYQQASLDLGDGSLHKRAATQQGLVTVHLRIPPNHVGLQPKMIHLLP